MAAAIAAVLLTGSRTRSATSAGSPTPPTTSDFDVYVVTNHRLPAHRVGGLLRALARSAAASRERFRVDLHVLARAALPRLPPVMRYFDLQRDAQLLAGVDLRHELVRITAADLPAYEGLRRMLNAVFFFLEKIESKDHDGGSPLAYLYREATHAFAVPVGTYGGGIHDTLRALEGSAYGTLLRARIGDYASKFRTREAGAATDAWTGTLLDYTAMIDLYAECAYGIAPGAPADDRLRGIARHAFAPYVAWKMRRTLGASIAREGRLARTLARSYQIAASARWRLRGELVALPAAAAVAVDPGLKIYWLGRRLLERVARRGASYTEDPALAADVTRFRRVFAQHFLSSADSRTIVRFGAGC